MTTLQDYLDDNSVDLVDSILTDPDGNAYSYSDKAGKAIWAMYRYAMMNCKPTEKYITRWIQRGRDMVYNLDERYSQLFKAYEALKDAGRATSLDMTDTSKVVTDSLNTTENEGDVTVTGETIPQYADASADSWLNSRAITDDDTKQTAKGQVVNTATATTMGGNLPIELMNRMRNGLFNPYYSYAEELSELWVPFYVDEGCWCE